MRRGSAIGVTLASLMVAGCLFRTAEAPRFYRPASAILAEAGEDEAETAPSATGVPIRLHGVRSAPFLRERIVWRASSVEYGLYEQRRWFELPSRYVKRALTSALQTEPALRLTDDGTAARLEVEILAFDEVLTPTHEAAVTLAATLREGTDKRFDRTFSSRIAIADNDGATMAAAMGQALDVAVHKVVKAAAKALGPKAAAPTGRPRRQ
ncbi:MAG: ABC-type transport auxiliary lipoprotein family protein [Candidatus Binatia bacterium]